MRKMSVWLLSAVLALSCGPPLDLPENCRDIPSDYDVLVDRGGSSYVRLTCSWAADTFSWSCTGDRWGDNWHVIESASARYLSEADVVAERTPGVVRAVESSYGWSSSKGGSVSQSAQYAYDDQRRLVSKTVEYKEVMNPSEPKSQDQVYTFSSWDERGRPLAGDYTSTWQGTGILPACSDTFTLSYDDAAGRITRTAGTQGCAGLTSSLSAEEFGVNALGEKLLSSPRTLAVHKTQRFCLGALSSQPRSARIAGLSDRVTHPTAWSATSSAMVWVGNQGARARLGARSPTPAGRV